LFKTAVNTAISGASISLNCIKFQVFISFCTLKKTICEIENLSKEGANIYPIMSETVSSTDTRFGKCTDFINQIENICKKNVIKSIPDAEPIGPQKMFDLLIVAPCTGNTLAKIACGIADSPVST